jgi:hypothetical protein
MYTTPAGMKIWSEHRTYEKFIDLNVLPDRKISWTPKSCEDTIHDSNMQLLRLRWSHLVTEIIRNIAVTKSYRSKFCAIICVSSKLTPLAQWRVLFQCIASWGAREFSTINYVYRKFVRWTATDFLLGVCSWVSWFMKNHKWKENLWHFYALSHYNCIYTV